MHSVEGLHSIKPGWANVLRSVRQNTQLVRCFLDTDVILMGEGRSSPWNTYIYGGCSPLIPMNRGSIHLTGFLNWCALQVILAWKAAPGCVNLLRCIGMVKKPPLPPMNKDGALPHRPGVPPNVTGWSPHLVSIEGFVKRFATSSKRIQLLEGFLWHRALLRSLGFKDAFQWVNGSFVEFCEPYRPASPKDIDVLTFVRRPDTMNSKQFRDFLLQNNAIGFAAKARYDCDSYVLDLDSPPRDLVLMVRYWFGLFSVRRDPPGGQKGFVELALDEGDNDQSAYRALTELNSNLN